LQLDADWLTPRRLFIYDSRNLNFDIAILEVAKFQLRDMSGHVWIYLVLLTAVIARKESRDANSDRVCLVVIVTYKILSAIIASNGISGNRRQN